MICTSRCRRLCGSGSSSAAWGSRPMTKPIIYDLNVDPTFEGTPAHRQLLEWLTAEGLDPARIMRIEVQDGDPPHARIIEVARDEHGNGLLNDDGTAPR